MDHLGERIKHCRDEAAALRGSMPGARWDALLAELAALSADVEARRDDHDALLREVTLVLSCTQAGRVVELIMDAVTRLSGAQRGFLLLQHDDGSHEMAAARNLERTAVETPTTEVSRRIVSDVLATGRALRLEDALNTPPYDLAESMTRLKIVSVLCVPIAAGDRVLGCVYLENRKLTAVFTPETEDVVEGFAALMGPALLNAREFEALRHDTDRSQRALAEECGFDGVVGHSKGFSDALRTVAIAADSDIPILIEGETGTGKELVARAVHVASPRKAAAFVSINCAELPPSLLESELFGHRRGAFTGAVSDRRGLFATAHGGTLFLDEVGEMPAELQVKLLRVLQSGEYRAVGSDRPAHADVRVVAATLRNLKKDVDEGRFRQDLFFRLKGVHVHLPPLRQRREDIPPLVERFMARYGPTDRPLTLDDDAYAALLAYDYPGNVRELETFIQRAALFARNGVISVDALPPEVVGTRGGALALPPRIPATADELLAAKKTIRTQAVRNLERAFLLHALTAADGKPGEAARRVGMNRSQFARMLSQHGLAQSRGAAPKAEKDG